MRVKTEQIVDVLITALEGGSNYWYEMDYTPERPLKWKGSLTEYLIDQVLYHDAVVKIFDVEEPEECVGEFSRKNVVAGLKKIEVEMPEIILAVLNEEYDAGDADILFQYIVMGEVVYG